MFKPAVFILSLLVAATSCSPRSNVIFGSAQGGQVGNVIWPFITFVDVNSVFGSEVALFDASGHPTGERRWVVILSDQDNFCNTLKANRDYFRRPATTAFQALILFLPVGRLGTFEVGRVSDEGTGAEIYGGVLPAADAGPGAGFVPAPFIGVTGGFNVTFIALTNWNDGASSGNFNLAMTDPGNTATYGFSGNYQAGSCDGLDGTLLP